MSKFFKALEQADRERALQENARRRLVGERSGEAGAESGTRRPEDAAALTPGASSRAPASPAPDRPPGSTSRPMADPCAVETADGLEGVEGHLVSLLQPTSFLAEPYRALRHLVEQLHRTAQLSVVAVSSASVGDGKTTTAINLAGALAQAPETRVLLVDTDLRRASVAGQLGLGDAGRRGLVDAILDPTLALDDVVSPRPPFNLDVLPAGTLPPAPYEVLKSPRLGDLLAEARRRYDHVVLDTAPLVPVPDTRLVAKWIDGLLLVVAAHKTPRRLVAEALNLLDPAKLVGLVFNEDDGAFTGYYHATYGADPTNGASPNGHSPARWRAFWRRRPISANV